MQSNKSTSLMVKEKFLTVIFGTIIGFINGIFGGGGGMVVVPVLHYLLKKPLKVSHATAILIILPISLASAIVYLINGYFNFSTFLPTGIGVIIGGILGAVLLSKFKNDWLAYLFSGVMLIAGIYAGFF